MSQRIAEHDWADTPLGPADQWPQSLRTAVRIVLGSRFAMWMAWGPELTFFYNDKYAADGGRVAIAGWMGGYGNYTCIQHTGSLSTCYGHQSRIAVSVGQSVSQGQVIGYSGNTGHSTGPHLHFEVRVGGSPVDPMGYL